MAQVWPELRELTKNLRTPYRTVFLGESADPVNKMFSAESTASTKRLRAFPQTLVNYKGDKHDYASDNCDRLSVLR